MIEVPVILLDLPQHVKGFVCLGSDFSPCIVLNSRLSYEQNLKTYRHELDHIRKGEMNNDNYKEYGT